MITITGTIAPKGKYLITGAPVSTPAPGTLVKLSFENNTGGTNVALHMGTTAEFAAGTGTALSDSGGPGFIFLTILDSALLAGQVIFAVHEVGTVAAHFTLIVD